MSMIIEQAGGAGSTGKGRILDVRPKEIHGRTPLFLGSVENVFELNQFFIYCKKGVPKNSYLPQKLYISHLLRCRVHSLKYTDSDDDSAKESDEENC